MTDDFVVALASKAGWGQMGESEQEVKIIAHHNTERSHHISVSYLLLTLIADGESYVDGLSKCLLDSVKAIIGPVANRTYLLEMCKLTNLMTDSGLLVVMYLTRLEFDT